MADVDEGLGVSKPVFPHEVRLIYISYCISETDHIQLANALN